MAAPLSVNSFCTIWKSGACLTLDELCVEWRVDDDWELEALSRRLRAMERGGQLMRNRRDGYGLISK